MTRRAEDLWRTWTHRPRVRSVARLPARAPRPGTPRGRRGTNTNRLAHAAPRRRAQEQTHSPASTVRTQPAQGLARALDVHHPTRGQTDQQPAEPALRGPVTFVQRLCRCGCPRAGCTCGIAHEQAPRRLRRGRAACPAQARLSLPLSSPWARAVRLRISVDPPARDRRRPPDRRLRIAGSSAARGGDRHRCDTHPKPPGRAILDLAVTRDLPDQGTHVLPDIWPRSTERKGGFCRKLFNGETGT